MQTLAAHYIFTGEGEPLRNAAIRIDEQGILREILTEFAETERTGFYDGILCPGMINAHCHTELSGMKGCIPEKLGLGGFVREVVQLRQHQRIQQDPAIKNDKLSYLQGTDAVGDICNLEDSAGWKIHSHIRYRNFIEVVGSKKEDWKICLDNSHKVLERMQSLGLTASLTPHALYSMSEELFSVTLHAAFESGFVSLHFRESPDEEKMFRAISEKPYIDYFLEQLSRIPLSQRVSAHLLLVHCTYATAEEIDRIRALVPHTYIALCPRSNLYIENRLPDIHSLTPTGVPFCIGTDSLASNHSLSLLEEVLCLHGAFPHLSFFEILRWACANGAECLGFKNLGVWKIGEPISICHISGLHPRSFCPSEKAYSNRI